MFKHGQVVSMIPSFLVYHSESIFQHQWLHGAENPFVYAWQAAFHISKIGVQRFLASVHMEPNFLVFESFSTILNDVKLLVESLLIYVQVPLAFGTNLDPIMLPTPRLLTLSAFRYVLCLRCEIHYSQTFENTHDNFSHVRQPRHMLLQAIDAP